METHPNKGMLTKPATKFGLFCWCVFNWAHASFPTLIITFIFSTYFTRAIVHNTVMGTSYWGWGIGISGILVAISSPFLGSINDFTGRRKPWLAIFTLICIICTALLFFAKPNHHWMWYALILVGLGNIAYEFTQLFYNGMMVSIAPRDYIGRLSGWGWALGYIGGLTCLAIGLFCIIKAPWIPSTQSLNVRATTLLVAVWFLIFAIPLFIFTPDLKRSPLAFIDACQKGVKQLYRTFHQTREYKGIFIFLIGYLIYTDGLNTLFILGGVFASGSFHMNYTQILIFAILLNVTSAIGAFGLAFVDDWVGPKFTICLSLIATIIVGSVILFVYQDRWFWILAAILGLFVGPLQAASRSYMARIAPKHLVSQMFGLYQIAGRITAFLGPILVGTFTDLFQSQRVGMGLIPILLLLGLVILFFSPRE